MSYCSTEMGERCTFKDDDDCSFSFSYKENPGKDVLISVQKEKGTVVVSLNICPDIVHTQTRTPTLWRSTFGCFSFFVFRSMSYTLTKIIESVLDTNG